MGLGSSRAPSSRMCTFIPAASMKVDGRGAQRAVNDSSGRSGAQLITTKAATSAVIAITAPLIIHPSIFMVFCSIARQGVMADGSTVFRQS